MGIYFNPKNRSFSKDRNYEIYVDKTGLLSFLNKAIDTPKTVLLSVMPDVLVNLMLPE